MSEDLACSVCGAAIKPTTFKCGSCGKLTSEVAPSVDASEAAVKAGCVALIGLAVAVVALLLLFQSSGGEPTPEERSQAIAEAAERVEYVRKGFDCVPPAVGFNSNLITELKTRLRDPDSFQHINTVITPVENGKHGVVMTYRAKNGFGGYNVAMAVGSLDHETCQVISLEMVQ